jgi:flagellar hook-length control protein FliK
MPWRPGGHPTTPGVGIAAASPLGAALAATEHPEAEILIEAPTAAAQALLSNAVPLAIAVTPSHTSPRPAGTADTTVPVAAPEAAMPTIPATMVVNAEAARSAPRAASLPPSRQVLPMAVALLVSPGASPTLSVTLEPAELGRLQIRVSRDSSGASLRLIAERPETLTLLARDQRELQQGLTQSGIALNVDGISFEMAGDGGQPRQDPQPAPRGRPPLREAAGAAPPADTAGAVSSLLDMRV